MRNEEDVDDFIDDSAERAQQLHLSKRTHLLLALGRAAELRALVEKDMRASRLQLPDVVVGARPRIAREAAREQPPSVAPPSNPVRTRRPAPRARQLITSAERRNVHSIPTAQRANGSDDSERTSREMPEQTSSSSAAEFACRDQEASDVEVDGVEASSRCSDAKASVRVSSAEVQLACTPMVLHTFGRTLSTSCMLDDNGGQGGDSNLQQQLSPDRFPRPHELSLWIRVEAPQQHTPLQAFRHEANQAATPEGAHQHGVPSDVNTWFVPEALHYDGISITTDIRPESCRITETL
eukprot:TRINITY_DN64740_c0_g1_i1.p1 TRINITY_DN64740_c0_g1~~TRINITY_DN64740_c0_g1_i1.p1  ORF type:complete len:295 (+),score=43.75 TRINITY_DN64740_c0_g1_i1:145-1029(+)